MLISTYQFPNTLLWIMLKICNHIQIHSVKCLPLSLLAMCQPIPAPGSAGSPPGTPSVGDVGTPSTPAAPHTPLTHTLVTKSPRSHICTQVGPCELPLYCHPMSKVLPAYSVQQIQQSYSGMTFGGVKPHFDCCCFHSKITLSPL